MPQDDGAIAFAEKLLLLLEDGHFTSTYKFAVLLALLDLCLEHTDRHGNAPDSITTVQLAEKVLELYWPHTSPFVPGEERVLRQNRVNGRGEGQAEILRAIRELRTRAGSDASEPLSRARLRDPAAFARLLRRIEWKLVEMPLPRLQVVGKEHLSLVYVINWDTTITKARFERAFDNAIRFVPGASEHLVRLAGLLRPLIQRRWAAMVARLNDDVVQDAKLEEFLFGVSRISLEPVRADLRELQGSRCFYCDRRLGADVHVDHFVPWVRYANNAIENLVVADGRCNGDKCDYLASADHVARWAERNVRHADDLAAIAERRRWERRAAETLSVARGIYLRLPRDARLWRGPRELVAIDETTLRRALDAA